MGSTTIARSSFFKHKAERCFPEPSHLESVCSCQSLKQKCVKFFETAFLLLLVDINFSSKNEIKLWCLEYSVLSFKDC